MNIKWCFEQDAAAYKSVLHPNHYSEAPALDALVLGFARMISVRCTRKSHRPRLVGIKKEASARLAQLALLDLKVTIAIHKLDDSTTNLVWARETVTGST